MADINEDCLIIYHYKPPLLNGSLETALDNVVKASQFEFGHQNGFCLNFVPYVRRYLAELELDNVLSNPLKYFANRVCRTCEDSGWRVKRFERYRLMTHGLNLLERGHFLNMESNFGTFFEKQLISSHLTRQQYEKWKVDVAEAIRLLEELRWRHELKPSVPIEGITEVEEEAITKIAFELNKDLRSMKRMENCGYGSNNEETD